MANETIAESTSSAEHFSPTSTFHASPEAALPKPLDLALAMVLHIISFSVEDDSYLSPLAVISSISSVSVNILLSKAATAIYLLPSWADT